MISYEIRPGVNLLPKWDEDIDDSMYYMDTTGGSTGNKKFEDAKIEFLEQQKRINLLKDPEYLGDRIEVTLYGAMLKRLLQSTDIDFQQQGDIIGIQFVWYAQGDQFMLDAIGIDKDGNPSPKSPQPEPRGHLFDALRGAKPLPVDLFFSYTTDTLLMLLGFKKPFPSCGKQKLVLYPVITSVEFEGKLYTRFALACSVPSTKRPAAYGPPCPPFCYPPQSLVPVE